MATMITMLRPKSTGTFYPGSNVQELINLPEEEYDPPEWPIPLPDVSDAAHTEFGEEMRNKYFYLDPDWSFLNHGAYGSSLRPAIEFAQALQIYAELQPLRFYDRLLLPLMVRVTRRMAKFVGCSASNLVLIENATIGTGSVIQSMDLGPGDSVCAFNFAYGAVKSQLFHWCQRKGVKINQVNVKFPLKSEQELLSLFEEVMSDPRTRLVVVDHIPSQTPMILPLKKMIQLCHQRNIRVLVDGAHAIGSLDLRLDDLGADYYVANAHKWLCAPNGCAILYCRPEWQDSLHCVAVSLGHGHGMASDFLWPGTKDCSHLLSLEVVVDFWEAVGVERIRKYIFDKSMYYRNYLTKEWNSQFMTPCDMLAPCNNIQLPYNLYKHCDQLDIARCEFLQNELCERYKVEIPVKAVDDHLYVRLSYFLYNTKDDIDALCRAVKELTEQEILLPCNDMTIYR